MSSIKDSNLADEGHARSRAGPQRQMQVLRRNKNWSSQKRSL